MPLQGLPLMASIKVDTVPLYSSGGGVKDSAKGKCFEGFIDSGTHAVQPFALREIEIVEGNSLRAFTAGQDAMAKAGRIDIDFHTAVLGVAKTVTRPVAASGDAMLISMQKAKLNGLGTAAPVYAGGTVTCESRARELPFPSLPVFITTLPFPHTTCTHSRAVTSSAHHRGARLGSLTINYRDRSAVCLWLDAETGGGGSGERKGGAGGGGGAGAGGAGSKRAKI